jgi:hypothetical protein
MQVVTAGLKSNKNNTNEQENWEMILYTVHINKELLPQSVQKLGHNMHYATINQYAPIFLFSSEGENADSKTGKLVHFIVIK